MHACLDVQALAQALCAWQSCVHPVSMAGLPAESAGGEYRNVYVVVLTSLKWSAHSHLPLHSVQEPTPIDESQLPLTLPDTDDFKPSGEDGRHAVGPLLHTYSSCRRHGQKRGRAAERKEKSRARRSSLATRPALLQSA